MAEKGQTVEQFSEVTEILQNLQVEAKVVDIVEAGYPLNSGISDDSLEVTTSRAIGDASSTTEAYDVGVDTSMYYAASNGYVGPQAYYYGGYKYSYGDWDEYACQVGLDGIPDAQTMAVYNENGSMLYPATGYGYTNQPIYNPYTPAPSAARSDGQLYGTQAYKYAGDLHQPSIGAVSTSVDLGGDDISGGAFANDSHSSLVQRPSYSALALPPPGSFVVGAMPPSQQAQHARSAYGAYRPPTWHVGKRFSQAQSRPGMSQSPPVSRVAPNSYRPVSHVVPRRPQYRASAVVPSTPEALNRASYSPSTRIYASSSPQALPHGFGMSGYDPRWGGRSWVPIDKMRPRGRGNAMLFDANVTSDLLNEQNRGPRIRRLRNQRTYIGSAWLSRSQNLAMSNDEAVLGKDQYNRSDFLTNHNFAKFFVIKSYSEDDIHKSIKYNVWASTPNGNKKLAVAYQEAHEKNEHCPVFLLFSVNASGQFCGVAEMVGPVDFNESMGFWQQDKWAGKFSVKWHIIKDVPNNQFRHIIMENNDNKPVTNSRDTQEVKLEHGIEMLNIFKNYTHRTSILDDFQYYDRRQKVMQDKKGKQLSWQLPQQVAASKVTTETDIHTREGDGDLGRDSDGKNNVETHVKAQGGDETNPEEVRPFVRTSSLTNSDIMAPKVILERKNSPVVAAFSANDSPPQQNSGLTV